MEGRSGIKRYKIWPAFPKGTFEVYPVSTGSMQISVRDWLFFKEMKKLPEEEISRLDRGTKATSGWAIGKNRQPGSLLMPSALLVSLERDARSQPSTLVAVASQRLQSCLICLNILGSFCISAA